MTKFAPDWCFGLLKQRTRRTFISSLFDIGTCVEESASVNVAELEGLHDGTVLVSTYDWTNYLSQHTRCNISRRTNLHTLFKYRFRFLCYCRPDQLSNIETVLEVWYIKKSRLVFFWSLRSLQSLKNKYNLAILALDDFYLIAAIAAIGEKVT